jgi:hypothetical protein
VRATEGEKGGLPRPEPEDPRNVEEPFPAADAVVWNEVARLLVGHSESGADADLKAHFARLCRTGDGEPYLRISVATNCPLAARDELDRKGTVSHRDGYDW